MAGKNTVIKEINNSQIFPDIKNFVGSSTTFNQGDFLFYDAATQIVKILASETDAATMVGVAALSIVNGKPVSPYQGLPVDAAQAIPSMNGPLYGNTNSCVLKTGVSINPGAALYADPATSARGVSPSGTKQIGVYQGAAITSSAAGLEVEVLVGARFPNDSLKF